MARAALIAIALVCGIASTSHAAAVIFIDDIPGYNAATLGLQILGTEDFENNTAGAGGFDVFGDPLAPGIANARFPSGTLAALGMTVQSNSLGSNPTVPSPHGGSGLQLLAGSFGAATDQVFNNQQQHSFDMLFANPTTSAVSFNPLISSVAGNVTNGTATIRVFDQSNNLIGQSNNVPVVNFQNPTTFIGVVGTAGDLIGRINVDATSAAHVWAGADNVTVAAVPEPSSFLFLALVVLSIGAWKKLKPSLRLS